MKRYTTLILVMLSLCAFAQQNKATFHINGQLKNAANLQVFLEHQIEGKWLMDSTKADATGKFVFKGKVPEPRPFYLSVEGYRERCDFFVENTDYFITGDVKHIAGVKVKGAKEQNIYQQYKQRLNQLNHFMGDMQKPLNYVLKQQKDTAAFTALVNASTILWRDSLATAEAELIAENPSSGVSVHLMKYLSAGITPVSKLDSLMRIIESTSAKQYPSAHAVRELINSRMRLSVGVQAPNFSQPDANGKAVSLSNFRGKYVLVDFWASWCAPCRAENPNVLKAFNHYQNKNFTVLAISIDEDKNDWLKAVKEDGLPWQQVSDLQVKNAAAKLYAVTSIPTNFLIDPEGKIIAINLRGPKLEQALEEHLGKAK